MVVPCHRPFPQRPPPPLPPGPHLSLRSTRFPDSSLAWRASSLCAFLCPSFAAFSSLSIAIKPTLKHPLGRRRSGGGGGHSGGGVEKMRVCRGDLPVQRLESEPVPRAVGSMNVPRGREIIAPPRHLLFAPLDASKPPPSTNLLLGAAVLHHHLEKANKEGQKIERLL